MRRLLGPGELLVLVGLVLIDVAVWQVGWAVGVGLAGLFIVAIGLVLALRSPETGA